MNAATGTVFRIDAKGNPITRPAVKCPGCGREFAGERGLRSHQTAKFVAMGCKPR